MPARTGSFSPCALLREQHESKSVTVAPVEGEANKAAVLCLSRALGIPKTDIQIVRGSRGRLKSVRVPAYAELAVKRLFVIHR